MARFGWILNRGGTLGNPLCRNGARSRHLEVLPLTLLTPDPHADMRLFWLDQDGRIIDVNALACWSLGYSRDQLRSLTIFDIECDFPRSRWSAHWRELFLDGRLRFRTLHRHQDGSRQMVEVVANYFEIDGRAYDCVIAYPLTPQRQSENALRESEQRLSLALRISGQGLYDLDLTTGEVVFNDGYALMMGYSPQSLRLTPELWASWLHPDERVRILALLEDCISGPRDGYQAELRLRTRRGHWIWVAAAGQVLQRDATGRAVRIMGTQVDITARKEAEAAARAREEQLARQNQALVSLMATGLPFRGEVIDPIREITEICAALIEVDRISVWRYAEDYSALRCLDLYQRGPHHHGAGAEIDSAGVPECVASHREGQVIVAADVRRDARTCRLPADYLAPPGIRSLLDAPIWIQGRVGGVLRFEQGGEGQVWSGEDERLAGTMATLLALSFEASDRHQAEQALRESEERFRSIFEHSAVGIALVSEPRARISVCNAGFQQLLGYRAEQLVGMSIAEVTDPEDRARGLALYRDLCAGRISHYRDEKRYRRRDGTVVWVDLSVSAICNQWGGFRYALGMAVDITARKRAEIALRSSQGLLDHLIDQSPLPIVIYDRGGAIVRANPAVLDLFGLTDQVLAGYNLFEDAQLQETGLLARLARVFRDGETVRLESRYDAARIQSVQPAPPPRCFDLDSTLFAIRDERGEISHVVLYHLDITERRAAEARLRDHLEFEQAVAEISALMIRSGWDDVGDRVQWVLERIGLLTRVARGYLLTLGPDGQGTGEAREWCAAGVASQLGALRGLAVADLGGLAERLREGAVQLSVAGLPDAAAVKSVFARADVRSSLWVPVAWDGRMRGVMGLDAVGAERAWLAEEVRLLRMVAEIVAHTLQHIEADRELTASARYLADLDRISRILTGRGRDADAMRALADEILDIFQADRVFFIHPCDPDAPTFHIRMESSRPEWPGAFTLARPQGLEGVELAPDDSFRQDVRVLLERPGPLVVNFAARAAVPQEVRRYGIQSQMMIALRPEADQPWLLGVQQCAGDRRWSEAEQRLFQAIAERVSDALSGYLLLERLRESEQRYRVVFESTHDAIIVHDYQGVILAVNQTMLDLYGLDQCQALAASIPELSGPGNPPGSPAPIWTRVADGEVLQFEWNARRPKDGSCFPVEVVLRAIQFGGADCVLANVRDITERWQAEHALRQSEERFAKAFRSSPAAIVISTLEEGRFIDMNDRWLDLLGYAREELLGHTAAEIGLWVDPEMRAPALAEIARNGAFRDLETRIRTKSGELRDQLWSAETVTVGGQRVLLSHIYDVTERRRAEKALRLAELSIMRSVDAVFWIAPDGHFLNVNAQACDGLGYRREELLGMTVWDINPEFSEARWAENWQRTRQAKRRRLETLHRRKDGTVFPVEVTANYIHFDGEDYDFAFVRDITEQKRAATELQRYQEHLEELVDERTRALQQANADLRQAMTQLVQSEKLAALGNLVAGVAHELSTPLGNARIVASALGDQVRAFGRLLDGEGLRRSQLTDFLQQAREAVDLLERNTARAADLIGHFKQVAVDQTSMRRRRFNLRETLEEVLITLGPGFKHTAHRVELSIPSELELDNYPGPLEQVVANLVGNSLGHAFAGVASGRIRIAAEPLDAAHLRLRYDDDGAGIPAELLDRVFDPFFTTRLGEGGSGLGLYIVYSLVTGALGGTIAVESAAGAGTSFILTLPYSGPDHQAVSPTPTLAGEVR